MKHGAVASGWCPVDDRVYEAADGVCPDCGTALVDAGPATPEPEAHPPGRAAGASPLWRAAIGVAIVGAFVLGLTLQQGKEPGSPRTTSSPVAVVQDVHVGIVARADPGDLRLNRLLQEGDGFTATFTIGRGFPDARLVRGVSVEMSTLHDGTPEVFGASDVHVTPVAGGFMVQGRLEPGAGRISELQVSSVQVGVASKPEWRVGIGGIWPVRGAEPAVMHIGSTRGVGEGGIRLVAVVAWKDRLEAAFALRGLGAGDVTGTLFAIDEIQIETQSAGTDRGGRASVLSATVQEQISPSQVVARFEGVPQGVDTVTIRASRLSRFLAGPWTWKIG